MQGVLENKVGVVTGAGSGIGRAIAIAAAKAGSKVVVSDISAEGGNETVAMIRASGGEAEFIETNVADPEAIVRMVKFTVDQYGGLNWACNNAAAGQFGSFIDTPDEVWDRTIAVTLSGVFYCLREQIKAMLPTGGGNIVNISSRTGVTGTGLQATYAAAKGGVEILSKSVAGEYARHGIRVNSVAPGPIKTPAAGRAFADNEDLRNTVERNVGARRMGEPEEVAELVVFLASDQALYLNGESILIDGASGSNSSLDT